MDFAFAPGATKYDRIIRQLYRNRPTTTLLHGAGFTDVASFVAHVNGLPGDPLSGAWAFHIGTHGDDNAYMSVPWNLEDGTPHCTWEDMDFAHNIQITEFNDEIVTPRPLDENHVEIPARLLIKGCRIALSQGFMDKMKEAINGASTQEITVTAPKFYHVVHPIPYRGVFEYFEYNFNHFSKTRITSRADLIAALVAEGHIDIHGNAITEAQYNGWVPNRIHATVDPLRRVTLADSPVPRLRRLFSGRYRHTNTTIIQFETSQAIPAGEPARIALVKSELQQRASDSDTNFNFSLRDDHPFPAYARYGFTDLDDMVDNLTWTFPRINATKHWMIGKRHEYDVNPPIVDTNGNDLIYNYYPNTGSGTNSVTNFSEIDDRFYITT